MRRRGVSVVRRLWWLPVVAAVVTAAGCGDGSGDGVATLGGRADAEEAKARDVDPQEAFQKFAECMREHGVEMPDPEVGGEGEVAFRGPIAVSGGPASGSEGGDTVFQEARAECEHLIEGVGNAREAELDPEERERMKRRALKFSQCMRDAGIDFPDPEFGDGGGVSLTLDGSASVDPNDPTFQAAQEKCREQAGMPKPNTVAGGEGRAGGGEGPVVVQNPGGDR